MKHSELEAARRILFFSAHEAATLISNTTEQAWRRWETGARRVPLAVAAKIDSLLQWRGSQIAALLEGRDHSVVWFQNQDDWLKLGAQPLLWRPYQSVCAAVIAADSTKKLVDFDSKAHEQPPCLHSIDIDKVQIRFIQRVPSPIDMHLTP